MQHTCMEVIFVIGGISIGGWCDAALNFSILVYLVNQGGLRKICTGAYNLYAMGFLKQSGTPEKKEEISIYQYIKI